MSIPNLISFLDIWQPNEACKASDCRAVRTNQSAVSSLDQVFARESAHVEGLAGDAVKGSRLGRQRISDAVMQSYRVAPASL